MEVSNDGVLEEDPEEKIGRTASVDSPNNAVLGEGAAAVAEDSEDKNTEAEMEAENHKERKRQSEKPPEDDCCPICFGSFTVPCRADCGHWYCGSCILQFWSYSAASRPCKCPMCARHIIMLSPEASLLQCQEREVIEVLAKVRRYNRLFVGGITGLVQKLRELPLLMKRMLWNMMDPDANNLYLHEVRLFAMFMSILYTATEFDFIPTGSLGIARVFDYGAVATVIILRLVGLYRRRRLAQRVRHLAAAQLQQE